MVSRDLSSDALTSDWEAWLLLLLLRGTSLRFFKTEQTVTTAARTLQSCLCSIGKEDMGPRPTNVVGVCGRRHEKFHYVIQNPSTLKNKLC